MKLLYYYWGEITAKGAQEALTSLGIQYKVVSHQISKYDYDADFIDSIKSELIGDNEQLIYDAIFSFNYFPDLSRVAEACGVKYISWVYDSPHNTLESVTLPNHCNSVFIFDYALYKKYFDEGMYTVYYQPLPARIVDREKNINCLLSKKSMKYNHDISFVGNLYDGEKDLYGKISYIPNYFSGYFEALIDMQMHIYGADIIDELIDEDMLVEIAKYVKTDLGDNYRKCSGELFKNILKRRVTRNERIEILKRLGNEVRFVDLYCEDIHSELPVKNCGYAGYDDKMIEVFSSSKINLNVTLRSIRTGIPLRVMDILGAGGFCITNYQAEIEEYFENGVDIVWYESIDDLIEKCRYYLDHDEEREQIARNGQRKVKELFAYEIQFKKMLTVVEK